MCYRLLASLNVQIGYRQRNSQLFNSNGDIEIHVYCLNVFAAFSLTQWYTSSGLTAGSNLTTLETRTLMETLGVGHFLQDVGCQRSGSTYSPSQSGWKSGTEKTVWITRSYLASIWKKWLTICFWNLNFKHFYILSISYYFWNTVNCDTCSKSTHSV